MLGDRAWCLPQYHLTHISEHSKIQYQGGIKEKKCFFFFFNSQWGWRLKNQVKESVQTLKKLETPSEKISFEILFQVLSWQNAMLYQSTKYNLSGSMFCISNCHLRSLHRICINWFPNKGQATSKMLSSFRLEFCLEIPFEK